MSKTKSGYISFEHLENELRAKGTVSNPAGLAAKIGRERYGKKAFQAHAASGTSMRNVKPLKKG